MNKTTTIRKGNNLYCVFVPFYLIDKLCCEQYILLCDKFIAFLQAERNIFPITVLEVVFPND